jgi:S-sulfosulfanyl-L-cysteine sulfohydrolase
MHRRSFLRLLALASAAGLALGERGSRAQSTDSDFYDLPPFGNVGLLHLTDCHAQLLPVYYREPDTNLGAGLAAGKPPHLTGDALLSEFNIPRGSAQAYAFTHLDFAHAAKLYGKVGGFAHLATLVKKLRTQRPGALLLDGGDTWQGSATALWTRGEDMAQAAVALGVDIMTAHWEFTYGADRVQELIDGPLHGHIEFLAQNVRAADFGDPVFPSHTLREVNGIPIAVIGQAFPYTPIAHPRRFVAEWSFGIQEEHLQRVVHEARRQGARVVVLLSHNGMDVDLKLATRVTGIDAILGGHTHDGVPAAIPMPNASGKTLVTNAGSNGKFLGVLDLDVKAGRIIGYRYRLLPVFANLLAPDPQMAQLIDRLRAPYLARLSEPLARTESLLYRRGNFNGTFDEVILSALLETQDAQIALSPGFRWGTSLLPGDVITREALLDLTAITYPQTTVTTMTGATVKAVLEDVCDNLFHPDPYYQQGGDMVRVGGLTYACDPQAKMGQRIDDLRLNGKPLDAARGYRVAGWAPVAEGATGTPIWEIMETWLKHKKTVHVRKLNQPRLIGVESSTGA